MPQGAQPSEHTNEDVSSTGAVVERRPWKCRLKRIRTGRNKAFLPVLSNPPYFLLVRFLSSSRAFTMDSLGAKSSSFEQLPISISPRSTLSFPRRDHPPAFSFRRRI